MIGKWHLGDANHFPETHGFDVNIGGNHWGAPQTFWWPYRGDQRYGGEYRYVPHMEFGHPGEYLTDRLTNEAIQVIDKAGDRPFFVYLAHYAPHTPIEAKAADIRHFETRLKPGMHHQNAVYAAMIKNLDENVGRVLDQIEQRGLAQNTVVIFASDNGGFVGKDRGQSVPVTKNAPLRSGKGSLYEGGIRVPLMIRWPRVTKAGGVCREPVLLMDLFHTLRKHADTGEPRKENPNAKGQSDRDGLDLMPLLTNPSSTLGRESLCFHYPHYYPTTTPVSAIRAGPWKLLEYHEDQRIELYNLRTDLSESKDLAAEHPEQAAKVHKQLQDWRQRVQAAMPEPNPDYVPRRRTN